MWTVNFILMVAGFEKAHKSISSHLLSAPGPITSSGRVKKRGKGSRLSSKARATIESVCEFVEMEKESQ